MEDEITRAIRHGAAAGKLRAYIRQHGGEGLAGLLRLADRHSAASAALLKVAGADGDYAGPRPRAASGADAGDAREEGR